MLAEKFRAYAQNINFNIATGHEGYIIMLRYDIDIYLSVPGGQSFGVSAVSLYILSRDGV
jgi:hypothetical protein